MVRSVDTLLRSRLGLAAGLADPGVHLLDPAAGTLNFLRAAWRLALASQRERPGAAPLSHGTGIELLPDVHARGLTALRRSLHAADCTAGPERLRSVLGDALAPPPEILRQPFNVVIGNPPWQGRPSPHGPWITGLVQDYFQIGGRRLGERNPKWLHDDYVKFLRLAQWLIERNGEGLVAFVLNHNFIEAPTFAGLRCSLLRTFHEVYALDLHGNARRNERGNVFRGVAQGAAIVFLVRKPGLRRRVLRADLHGSREEKLKALARSDVGTTAWTELAVRPPAYLFVKCDRPREREYERGLAVPEIFPVHGTGIVTGRDAEVTAFDRDTLRSRFGPALEEKITPFLARPFDLRFLLYAEGFLARPRRALMSRLLTGDTVGLVVCRQCKGEPGALATRWIVGHKALCPHDVSSLFPLFLGAERRPNLAPGLAEKLDDWYGAAPEPEAILGYVLAVLSSAAYRRRYRDFLRRSFPRIEFPRDPRLFAPVSSVGCELMELHLFRGRVSRPLPSALAEIEPEVWGFRIGGYPVLRQWLRARRGLVVDQGALQTLVEHLRLTIAMHARIDEVMCDWRRE